MDLFGNVIDDAKKWVEDLYSSLPWTQKRQEAVEIASKTNPLLQYVAIGLTIAIGIHLAKKL